MAEHISGKIQMEPQTKAEMRFLDEVVEAFRGGLKREVRVNSSAPFGKQQMEESLDQIMAIMDLPEVQSFLEKE